MPSLSTTLFSDKIMKTRILFILLLATIIEAPMAAKSQENRKSIPLDNQQWFVEKKILSNDNCPQIFKCKKAPAIELQQDGCTLEPINQELYQQFKNSSAFVEFDPNGDWAQFGLYINEEDRNSFNFLINGEQLVFNEDFPNFADITAFSDLQGFWLTAMPKDGEKASFETLKKAMPNWEYGMYKNMTIKNIQTGSNELLGSKYLEVSIVNFTSDDVDGKLYGRIYEAESGKLVMENNNCAYSPAGNEIMIEISLPESELLRKGTIYIAEIEMVDKTKNEEVIDIFRKEFNF